MVRQLACRFVLFSLFITSCTLPGIGSNSVTDTITPEAAPEQLTPTVQQGTPNIGITDTPVLPDTPEPTITSRPLQPSVTPYPDPWYIIQSGTPLATYNTPHEEAGCSWLGVGGQVFGPDTAPELGVSILVGGTLDGYQVGSLGTTGMETNIGEGGYEVTLADHPVDSSGTLWIQIVNSIGNPLSKKIYFDTVNNCEKNFILINFVRYTPSLPQGTEWNAFFPILMNRSSILSTPVP